MEVSFGCHGYLQVELSRLDELESAQHLLVNDYCNKEQSEHTDTASDPSFTHVDSTAAEHTDSATVSDPSFTHADSTAAELADMTVDAVDEQAQTFRNVHRSDSTDEVAASCAVCNETSSVLPSHCANSVSVSSVVQSNSPPQSDAVSRGQHQRTTSRGRRRKKMEKKNDTTSSSGHAADRCMFSID